MLTKFIFVLSIITNQGDLEMKAFDVEQCPDKTLFTAEMTKLKQEGQFINWQALCLDRGAKTEAINYEKSALEGRT
jgi:hypothetical protein